MSVLDLQNMKETTAGHKRRWGSAVSKGCGGASGLSLLLC
jgi:hypothetical protein